MLFVFIMTAADKCFYLVIQIYVVTYFYLLNLYNTLWPDADNDPKVFDKTNSSNQYTLSKTVG